MKRLLASAAFMVAISSVHAQFVLQGIVKDKHNNAPVAGATITVNNTSLASATDSEGHFHIELKRKPSSIAVTSVGYTLFRLNIPGNIEALTIYLEPSETMLNTVAVFGQRHGRTVDVLGSQELRRFSGLNLQDALNTIPGVNMQSRTPWGGQHIIIRGYYPSADNGRTNSENFAGLGYQLFIDNIPVTDATGTTVMDDIDFFNLGNVEVTKGPSPLYGNYIAGAVNLFTPRPLRGQTSLEEQALGGSYGLFRTNTIFQSSSGSTDIRLNYGHQTYDGFRPNDGSGKDFVTLTSNIQAGERQTISTYFSYNNSRERLAGEIDSADFYGRKAVSNTYYVLNSAHANIESFRAGVTDRYQFDSRLNLQTTLFVAGSTLEQAYAHGFNQNQNASFGGRAALSYQNAGSTGVSGTLGLAFQKTNQQMHGNFFLPFVMPPFTSSSPHNIPSAARNNALNYDVYTQWKFELPAQLSLTAGAALNFVEFGTQNLLSNGALFLDNPVMIKVFKPVITPGLSLSRATGVASSVYLSMNTGYAPPTLAQITSSTGAVNTDLQPERGIQYELGSRGSTLNNKLAWQAALFDMDITSSLVQETSNSISFFTNAGRQRNLGAEAYLGYAARNSKEAAVSLLRPWISYTWSHFTYIDFQNHGKSSGGADTVLADFSGNKVAAVPENVFNAGVDIELRAGVYFNTTYRYVDKAPVTFDNAHYMKPYSLLSGKIGYRHQFGKHVALDVYAGADNLLASTWYSFLFVGQNMQELAQNNDPYISGGGGDGYILPAPYKATFYGGVSLKYVLGKQ